jgi:hypothetical protein
MRWFYRSLCFISFPVRGDEGHSKNGLPWLAVGPPDLVSVEPTPQPADIACLTFNPSQRWSKQQGIKSMKDRVKQDRAAVKAKRAKQKICAEQAKLAKL